MWFRQLIREETGCASYLIGSSTTNECLVFDPLWDVVVYQKAARSQGLNITHVVDSHSHADHVSGARRLAERTGGTLFIPKRMEATYEAERLHNGETISLGEVEIKVIHTPGHRPEQINLLVRDRSRGGDPWCILTADSLLVGDLARPDLAEDARSGARALFEQTVPRLMALPDYVEVYPGHVAGST